MRPANAIMASLGTTVFEVMSRLAMEHGSINRGQGFPDEDGPRDIRQVAANALVEGPNQYPPMTGLAELRQAIAAHARRFYGLDYDWQKEIVVTSGATEALADCFLALLNPGDEVVLLEPLYDSYPPMDRACRRHSPVCHPRATGVGTRSRGPRGGVHASNTHDPSQLVDESRRTRADHGRTRPHPAARHRTRRHLPV